MTRFYIEKPEAGPGSTTSLTIEPGHGAARAGDRAALRFGLAEIGIPSRSLAFNPPCKVAVASFIAAANAAGSPSAPRGNGYRAPKADGRDERYPLNCS
jgi:hypothetical protein